MGLVFGATLGLAQLFHQSTAGLGTPRGSAAVGESEHFIFNTFLSFYMLVLNPW